MNPMPRAGGAGGRRGHHVQTADSRGKGGISSGAGNTHPQIIPHLRPAGAAGLWLQSASITSTIREGDLSVSKLKAGRLRVHFFNE